jgi:hypothetical protein
MRRDDRWEHTWPGVCVSFAVFTLAMAVILAGLGVYGPLLIGD